MVILVLLLNSFVGLLADNSRLEILLERLKTLPFTKDKYEDNAE